MDNQMSRREFFAIVAGISSACLMGCRERLPWEEKKRSLPPYDPRTPLGAMQARGVAITSGAYTDKTASGTYVTAVNGIPVETYDVDGYSPGVSADTFRLDQFGSWRRIEWYRGGVVVAMIAV